MQAADGSAERFLTCRTTRRRPRVARGPSTRQEGPDASVKPLARGGPLSSPPGAAATGRISPWAGIAQKSRPHAATTDRATSDRARPRSAAGAQAPERLGCSTDRCSERRSTTRDGLSTATINRSLSIISGNMWWRAATSFGTLLTTSGSIGKRGEIDHRVAHLVSDRRLQVGLRDQPLAATSASPSGTPPDGLANARSSWACVMRPSARMGLPDRQHRRPILALDRFEQGACGVLIHSFAAISLCGQPEARNGCRPTAARTRVEGQPLRRPARTGTAPRQSPHGPRCARSASGRWCGTAGLKGVVALLPCRRHPLQRRTGKRRGRAQRLDQGEPAKARERQRTGRTAGFRAEDDSGGLRVEIEHIAEHGRAGRGFDRARLRGALDRRRLMWPIERWRRRLPLFRGVENQRGKRS